MTECLDEEAILSFCQGSMPAEKRPAAEAHIAECEECRVLVSAVMRSSLVDPLERLGPPSGGATGVPTVQAELATAPTPPLEGGKGAAMGAVDPPVRPGDVLAGEHEVERTPMVTTGATTKGPRGRPAVAAVVAVVAGLVVAGLVLNLNVPRAAAPSSVAGQATTASAVSFAPSVASETVASAALPVSAIPERSASAPPPTGEKAVPVLKAPPRTPATEAPSSAPLERK